MSLPIDPNQTGGYMGVFLDVEKSSYYMDSCVIGETCQPPPPNDSIPFTSAPQYYDSPLWVYWRRADRSPCNLGRYLTRRTRCGDFFYTRINCNYPPYPFTTPEGRIGCFESQRICITDYFCEYE